MRLSLLCGAFHGMRREGTTWFRRVTEDAPAEVDVDLALGQCARGFVVAQDAVRSLRVVVVDSSDVVIARSQSRAQPYVMVGSDRAWCVEQHGRYRVRMEVVRGGGSVAVEVWTLPPR